MEINTLKKDDIAGIREIKISGAKPGQEATAPSAIIVRVKPGKKLSRVQLKNKGIVMIRQADGLWEDTPIRKKNKKKKNTGSASENARKTKKTAGIGENPGLQGEITKAVQTEPVLPAENPVLPAEAGAAGVKPETVEKKAEVPVKEPAITVKDLVIRYRSLHNVSIKRQLLNRHKKNKGSGLFEALHGVSFEINKGEILGIIGKNGSGKSTLLKTIGGIFSPDEGSVDLHGHNVSLLSIGVGFQKELSGRENIILSGLLLGYREREIRAKADEIIEFSELGDFIDKPVRTYSSGMYSKLAFSITAVLKTDIMLIDEVLSVGDQHFKKKSYAKMKNLISNKNRTVVIVSHSIRYLRELCTKVLWLHEGNVIKIGPADDVLDEYQAFMEK